MRTRRWCLVGLAFFVAIPAWRSSADSAATSRPPLTVTVLKRTPTPLLKADKPWESFCINTCSVVRDGGTWHMWYECFDQQYKSDNDAYFCYATSKDGVSWVKPSLGLVKYNSSKSNNILIVGKDIGGMSGSHVFIDPQAPSAERFKLLFVKMLRVPPNMDFGDKNPDWQICGATSADGLHWKMLEKPLLTRLCDTQNVVVREKDKYRLYTRLWRTDGRGGGDTRRRVVGYTESSEFGNFPQPREIFKADEHDPDDMDFYNTAASKLRDDLYMIFPSAFTHGDDLVVPQVAASRDGVHFVRLNERKSIFPLGRGFDSKAVYVVPSAIPAEKPDTFWIYYLGNDFKHGESVPKRVKYGAGIGRALLEVKGDLPKAN